MTTLMHPADDANLLAFFRAIGRRDTGEVSRILQTSQQPIALGAIRVGGTRQNSATYFLEDIGHQIYVGDTALHVAAAAYQVSTAQLLVAKGAEVRARNRRGAEPLHYAADGNPASERWNPAAQSEAIGFLIHAGADPNARDRSGVAPLHRAVRTRCSSAVQALVDNGAHARMANKTGSTPLHLAVQNTGRGDSGSAAARAQQAQIIELLLRHGAKPADTDAHGRTVADAATSPWLRDLLS
jgi:hypothetical protein